LIHTMTTKALKKRLTRLEKQIKQEMNPSVQAAKDKTFCRICTLSFRGLKIHLQTKHPEISLCQYKKKYGIRVESVDIMMDKLQCATKEELSQIMATSKDGIFKRLKNGTSGRNIQRAYEIIAILLDRMTDEQLAKSRRQIRFLMDTE